MNATALLRRDDDSGVATLTLQSPASRTALSLAMIEALLDGFAAIEADPAARVVVLAGEGAALSAGHDLKELQAHRNDPDHGRAFFERAMARCSELMRAIVAPPPPAANSSPPAISRSPAPTRAARCPACRAASSVRRRSWRSVAPSRASTRWKWR